MAVMDDSPVVKSFALRGVVAMTPMPPNLSLNRMPAGGASPPQRAAG
jgi:hypothetical protein